MKFTETPEQRAYRFSVERAAQRRRAQQSIRTYKPKAAKGTVFGVCLKVCAHRVMGKSVAQTGRLLSMPSFAVVEFTNRLHDSTDCDLYHFRRMAAELGVSGYEQTVEFIQAEVAVLRGAAR